MVGMTLTLGELIDTLECFPADLPVSCAGRPGVVFESWRGRYDELTLTTYDSPDPQTVCELLELAYAADGGTFTGYKGGEYRMDRRTPVWADEWGEYEENRIVGAALVDGVVCIATQRDT